MLLGVFDWVCDRCIQNEMAALLVQCEEFKGMLTDRLYKYFHSDF